MTTLLAADVAAILADITTSVSRLFDGVVSKESWLDTTIDIAGPKLIRMDALIGHFPTATRAK
jgi:hypothetical protein